MVPLFLGFNQIKNKFFFFFSFSFLNIKLKMNQSYDETPPEFDFDMLVERVASGGDGGEILDLLKAAWSSGFRLNDVEEQEYVIDYIHRACDSKYIGIKSYDELNAIVLSLTLIYSDDEEALKKALAEINVEIIHNSTPHGMGWTGSEIRMLEKSENHLFHIYNNNLIEMLLLSTKVPEKSTRGEHVTIITDPRTDPNEDDATAICSLLGENMKNEIYTKMSLLITGCPSSLDARRRGIDFVNKFHPDITTECAPIVGGCFDSYKRFVAPYDEGEEKTMLEDRDRKGSETKAIEAGHHIIDNILETTTILLLIGQVPSDFFEKANQRIATGGLSNLRIFSLQGPGFNIMGSSSDALQSFVNKIKEREGGIVQWSDNTAGLSLTGKEIDKRFNLLGCLNTDILSYRRKQILSFWATSALPRHFEGQFGGYSYSHDTYELLRGLKALRARKLQKTEF
ncbi:MAG: hypothetical protein CL916_10615 [Deltaproteobacteria bacterium]|nr:hypothetical protein [Deltaproteobacteria bacterium]